MRFRYRMMSALLVIGVAACSGGAADNPGGATRSGSSSAGTASGEGGVLTIGLGSDPGNLDPSMTVLSDTRAVSQLAYDSLVNQTPEGEFVSGIADEWEAVPTGVTFTLNPDVTCSDGSPFTASDAAATIEFISDPDNSSPLLGVMLPPGLTVDADDDRRTVTVTTPDPNPFLLNGFAQIFMVCRAGLDDRTMLAQQTAGTGPYVLSEAVADDHYTYVRNPDYAWGPEGTTLTGQGIPESVTVRIIPNATTLANLLATGEINIGSVVGSDANRLDEQGLDRIDATSPLGSFYFNQTADRPGADPLVREALITGLDIESLRKVGAAGQGTVPTGLVTVEPRPCGADTVTGTLPAYDVERARQLLDQAGWASQADGIRAKDGKPLKLTFIYSSDGGDSLAAAAELLGQMWRELGVETTLQSVTSTQFNEVAFGSGAWDAGWIPIGVNLPSQLAPFLSGPGVPDGTNFAALDNSTYNDNSVRALATGDLDEACRLWNEAEEALFTELDVVPMFDTTKGTFLNGASAEIVAGELVATSLRLTAGE